MNNLALFEDIRKELSVDDEGKIFVTRRGLARLCGLKSEKSIRDLLLNIGAEKNLSFSLEPFAGYKLEGAELIPDFLAFPIISHYAYKGRKQAQIANSTIGIIGFRVWGQQQTGYKSQEKLELPKSSVPLSLRDPEAYLAAETKRQREIRIQYERVEIDELVRNSLRLKAFFVSNNY